MTLESGTRLGHYEILSAIGKGGMGEVYRARDTKLGREVAIKVLPSEFSQDQERLARLEREARMLAALNHANIGGIYGLEQSDDTRFLVLELVEGETLADRLKRGAIPVQESLKLALQTAGALEAAHEKGVVHRDLKPANIKITPDGRVKVLDFGLAKAFIGERADVNLSNSPTLSMAATQAGMILGTAAYMSPEQAKGRPLDKRTDIWSFGCVLFELLAGRPAFRGEDVSDILGSVLKLDPAWDELPPNLHPRLREALERCLDKDARSRYHDIADVQGDLERIPGDPLGPVAPTPSPGWRPATYAVLGAAVALAVIAGVLALIGPYAAPDIPRWASDPIRFDVEPPEGVTFLSGPAVPFAVSPDGRMVVFAGRSSDGTEQLWLRALSATEARPVPGTEGAHAPFWSPRSDEIGFFTTDALMRVSMAGGDPATISRLGERAIYGIDFATWGSGDVIVFQTSTGQALSRVSVQSGAVRPATSYDPDAFIQFWPEFLPDGYRFFYLAGDGWHLASLDGADVLLPLGEVYRSADRSVGNVMRYAAGSLLFRTAGGLSVVPFDDESLEISGEPYRLLDRIPRSGPGAVPYSISQNGVIAYWTRPDGEPAELRWIDRNGVVSEPLAAPTVYSGFDLAPDDDRIAFARSGDDQPRDIWVSRLDGGAEERITFDGDSMTPLWATDGRTLAFASAAWSPPDLYRYIFEGGIRESLLENNVQVYPTGWEPDGGTMVFTQVDGSGSDIWRIDLGSRETEPLPLNTERDEEENGRVSADGRWIAYDTDASGRYEVVVAGYPSGQPRRTVSVGGGRWPRWRSDGDELYYLSAGNELMAVRFTATEDRFEPAPPRSLFPVPRVHRDDYVGPFVPSHDGQRFLFLIRPEDTASEPVHVIVNWPALIGD